MTEDRIFLLVALLLSLSVGGSFAVIETASFFLTLSTPVFYLLLTSYISLMYLLIFVAFLYIVSCIVGCIKDWRKAGRIGPWVSFAFASFLVYQIARQDTPEIYLWLYWPPLVPVA